MVEARYLASSGGRTAANPRYSSRSYRIFRVPATKNGTLMSAGRANMKPANTGARAAPVVRATPVMPAAAERSSGRSEEHTSELQSRGHLVCRLLLEKKKKQKTKNKL